MLATVLLAAAIFTRGFLLFLVLSLPIILSLKKKWVAAFGCIFLTALLLGSWCYRNYSKFGMFTMSTESVEIIWLGNNPMSKGSAPGTFNSRGCSHDSPMYEYLNSAYPGFCEKSEIEKAKVFSGEIRTDLWAFIKRGLYLAPKKVLIFFTPISWLGVDIVYFISLCLAIPGFFFLSKSRGWDSYVLAIVILPVAFCSLISILSYADIRHRHPINIQVSILCGYGAIFLWEKMGRIISKPNTE
jgi:hypothetical protein